VASAAYPRRKPSPILGGILPIDPSRVAPDLIAGATLAAAAIPEVMGYANIDHWCRPYDTLVVRRPNGDPDLVPLADGGQLAPGLIAYRFGSGIYDANANRFTEDIMDLVENADPPVRWLAIAGASISDIDYSGADTVRQVAKELSGHGVTLALSELSPKVRAQLDAYALTDVIGTDHIFETLRELAAAFAAQPHSGPPGDGGGQAPDAGTDAGTDAGQG